MQQAQFDHECMGVRITDQQLQQMKAKNSKNDVESFPILFTGTTQEEYEEALWVQKRSSTLYGDLDQYREGIEDSAMFDNCGSGFDETINMQDCETYISDRTSKLQEALNDSVIASSNLHISKKEKADFRKEAVELVDDVLDDPDILKVEAEKFLKSLRKMKKKRKEKILKRVGLSDAREGILQWSGLDCKDKSPEKRKKNVLG